MNIQQSYDAAAERYAEQLADELLLKPLDRYLLRRFAEAIRGRGPVADLGCGPGHVARFLADQDVHVVGIDLSPGMIAVARRLHPDLDFRVADMHDPHVSGSSFAGIVSFYAIVHTAPSGLGPVFEGMRRMLADGGYLIVAFHVGDQVNHLDTLFGAAVSLDFQFHDPRFVVEALGSADLRVIEHCEREPYPDVEYSSRRCYLLARAV